MIKQNLNTSMRYNNKFGVFQFGSETLADVLSREAQEVTTYVEEEDGEAIAWARDASGFYVLSEGESQPLYFYEKIEELQNFQINYVYI